MDAREALEIGTVTGYAAMWLMRAVAPAGGRLTAIERDSERFKLARDYLTRAGFGDQLVIHQGEWFSVLEDLDGPFDLIFLDIGLPEMNGFDLCTKARTNALNDKTPIVFITGMTTFQNRVQSSLSGGSDFVGKPFNIPELGLKALIWVLKGQLALE